MKRFTMPFAVILFITLFSCAAKHEMASEDMAPTEASESTAAATKTQLASVPANDGYVDPRAKLIKSVNYRFEVENMKRSAEAIELAVKKYPGYVSSSSLLFENSMLENKITIRIQNEYFYELLKDIDGQAMHVDFRNVSSTDVAKEFVDLESRLKTKREVEARYGEILRKKAGTIEELLNAEQKIGELHEEIEATVSRINYLRDQVSYSTINLEFYQYVTEPVRQPVEETLSNKFVEGLKSGWYGVVSVMISLTYIWPLLILVGATLYFVKVRHMRLFRAKQ